MNGVQTIGNATLVAYDKHPIISTDPWMGGDHSAYWGSWRLPYDIPPNIREDILKSEYINPSAFYYYRWRTATTAEGIIFNFLNANYLVYR